MTDLQRLLMNERLKLAGEAIETVITMAEDHMESWDDTRTELRRVVAFLAEGVR